MNYWKLVFFVPLMCVLAALVGQARGQEPPIKLPANPLTDWGIMHRVSASTVEVLKLSDCCSFTGLEVSGDNFDHPTLKLTPDGVLRVWVGRKLPSQWGGHPLTKVIIEYDSQWSDLAGVVW